MAAREAGKKLRAGWEREPEHVTMGGILVALAAVNDYTGWEARIRLATQGIPHARVYTCGMIAVLTAPVCGGRSQAWYLLLANGWLSGKRKGISLALQIAGEDFGTSPAPESQRKAKTNAYTTLVVSEVGIPCTTSNTPSAAICPVAFGFMTEPVCRVPPLKALQHHGETMEDRNLTGPHLFIIMLGGCAHLIAPAVMRGGRQPAVCKG